jgi:HAD superfamily hydrolase (TIGR01509 family)
MLQALIFDVDGTLAETEELHRAAFNAVFAEPGGPGWHWDQDLYAQLLAITGGKERIQHYRDTLGLKPLDRTAVASLHAAKTERYARMVAEGSLALRPGVRRLLWEAHRAGQRLAIATTTSLPNVEALLAACGDVPPFDVIAAGDEVPAKKPAPDIYLRALERLALPASACLAFEDTANGLASAAGAGLRCVMTVSAFGGTGPFPAATAVVSHLGEPDDPGVTHAGPAMPDGMADLGWLASLAADGA